MKLDTGGRALAEAAALVRLLHRNGSSGLIRALNARLSQAKIAYAEDHQLGLDDFEAEIKRLEEDFRHVDWNAARPRGEDGNVHHGDTETRRRA